MKLHEIKDTLEATLRKEINERESLSREYFVAARNGEEVDGRIVGQLLAETRTLKKMRDALKG